MKNLIINSALLFPLKLIICEIEIDILNVEFSKKLKICQLYYYLRIYPITQVASHIRLPNTYIIITLKIQMYF